MLICSSSLAPGELDGKVGSSTVSFFGYLMLISSPVWALVLLPLYVLLPRSSALWRVSYCTALGGIAGAVVALALIFGGGGFGAVAALWMYILVGALVGGATCWFGASTADYFHGPQPV
jgi:hypothetical protein